MRGRSVPAMSELGIAALRAVLPDSLIVEALRELEREGERQRKLPPVLVVWLLVGMGLFRSLSINAVLSRLRDALGDAVGWSPEAAPHATSISQARDRLGWEVVRLIFRRLVTLLVDRYQEAMSWRGLSVLTLDGATFLVPDTKSNDAMFGRPGTSRGGSASGFPQFRAVLVAGAWTHFIVDAVLAPYRVGELTIAEQLLPRLRAGSLLLMDRAYYSFRWLVQLRTASVHFVVRIKRGGRTLRPRRKRGRTVIPCPPYLRRRFPELPAEIEVRLVTYRRKGFRTITVATSLLDQQAYPADELAALYADRWEAELSNRELKTYLAREQVVFRSKTPDRVIQEAYGMLVAYNCVRGLMAEAAAMTECRPIDLSFKACLEQIRWYLSLLARAGADSDPYDLLSALALCRLPKRRRGRSCPRAVKIKMSKFPRKRPGQRAVAARGSATRHRAQRVVA